MNCREMTEFLADYVEGDLEAEMHAEFEVHLDRCPNCRVFLTQYRETIVAARVAGGRDSGERPELPEELVQAILKAMGKV